MNVVRERIPWMISVHGRDTQVEDTIVDLIYEGFRLMQLYTMQVIAVSQLRPWCTCVSMHDCV